MIVPGGSGEIYSPSIVALVQSVGGEVHRLIANFSAVEVVSFGRCWLFAASWRFESSLRHDLQISCCLFKN